MADAQATKMNKANKTNNVNSVNNVQSENKKDTDVNKKNTNVKDKNEIPKGGAIKKKTVSRRSQRFSRGNDSRGNEKSGEHMRNL